MLSRELKVEVSSEEPSVPNDTGTYRMKQKEGELARKMEQRMVTKLS